MTLWAFAALLAASASAQTPPIQSTGTAVSPGASDTGKAKGMNTPWKASGKGDWHKDCDKDVERLCPGMTDRSQIIDCLGKNTDKLSPACKQMRAKTEKRWKSEQKKAKKTAPPAK